MELQSCTLYAVKTSLKIVYCKDTLYNWYIKHKNMKWLAQDKHTRIPYTFFCTVMALKRAGGGVGGAFIYFNRCLNPAFIQVLSSHYSKHTHHYLPHGPFSRPVLIWIPALFWAFTVYLDSCYTILYIYTYSSGLLLHSTYSM